MSVVVCGHVDSGKSTTTGHLMYKLGGIPERKLLEMQTLAEQMGKGSFSFAFFLDTTKQERERGITIQCTTKEFHTSNYHYTIIDAPGHRDFMKNMISGASQADVGILMVPGDGNFATALAKGDPKAGEIKGQTREHARLLYLLGVKQLMCCVNKMDSDTCKYSEARFTECRDEVRNVLRQVGWPQATIEKNIAIFPISGFKGDNLFEPSANMPWWKGVEVTNIEGKTMTVKTVLEALNDFVCKPKRPTDLPARMPLSQVLNIKGVGDIVTGKVEQGSFAPGDEVIFLPSHTDSNPCTGKIFAIEMHHKKLEKADCGLNVGVNVKGLSKDYLPKTGDVMVLKKDTTIKTPKTFLAQVQVLDHPGELKKGYTPVVQCKTAKAPCKVVKIHWRMGKDTNRQKAENPDHVKANDAALIEFEVSSAHPIVVEPFDKSEAFGRIAILEGNQAVMLGRVTAVTYDESKEAAKGAKAKK